MRCCKSASTLMHLHNHHRQQSWCCQWCSGRTGMKRHCTSWGPLRALLPSCHSVKCDRATPWVRCCLRSRCSLCWSGLLQRARRHHLCRTWMTRTLSVSSGQLPARSAGCAWTTMQSAALGWSRDSPSAASTAATRSWCRRSCQPTDRTSAQRLHRICHASGASRVRLQRPRAACRDGGGARGETGAAPALCIVSVTAPTRLTTSTNDILHADGATRGVVDPHAPC